MLPFSRRIGQRIHRSWFAIHQGFNIHIHVSGIASIVITNGGTTIFVSF
ncbi:MAG: hypothetical protein KHX29_00880 [Prevotella buccalis]|nr:hypothetical protein [Hoylesella buccalis]